MPIIILLLDRGYKPQKIAELLNITVTRVYNHNKAYKRDEPRLREILNAAK
jgi:hypothetical protein